MQDVIGCTSPTQRLRNLFFFIFFYFYFLLFSISYFPSPWPPSKTDWGKGVRDCFHWMGAEFLWVSGAAGLGFCGADDPPREGLRRTGLH